MPRHPTPPKGSRLARQFNAIVRMLGLGAVAPSVANARKRLRHVRAAVQRLSA